ncbi:hypothetical protein V1511DRAFT_496205 [Dipodascopsis uninucleata]
MTVIPIVIRHSGNKYTVDVDLEEPGEVLKYQLYSLTGVEPDRQKILVKGGQLKNDTDLNTLGLKPNQALMMMGTPGELPKEPVKKMAFVEDMTDQQLAEKMKTPNGLMNLGNTCYLNSTLQCLRLMPELYDELEKYSPPAVNLAPERANLTKALREVYSSMKKQTSAYYPFAFLNTLRIVFPQFAEQSEGRYKQQDAEEAFSQILSAVNIALKGASPEYESFIDRYMTGDLSTEMKCSEAENEPSTTGSEKFLKLDCHISGETNFLQDGLQRSSSEVIEKYSETLGRNANYTLSKKITRLPKYLTVHFMRFYWRRDTGKKSKILRKVTFPFELDVTDLCSDDLKTKLVAVRDKVRDLRKAEEEKERARKRARTNLDEGGADTSSSSSGTDDVQRLREEVENAIDPSLKGDDSINKTGLYELIGVISHKGKSADSGHYQFFAKQTSSEAEANDVSGSRAGTVGSTAQKEETKWWRFNDDKVTTVDQAKIESMAGGGESDSALILLYRSIDI